jgi:type I restriction enzyme S subunit
MIQHATGTTMPSLNEGIIRRIPIVLKPSWDKSTLSPSSVRWMTRLSSNNEESHILATLRDMLLPRLLSGELRVAAVKDRMKKTTQKAIRE